MKQKKKLQKLLALVPALCLAWTGTWEAQASPSVYKTGTTIYDPAKAYNSFVVFTALDGKTHLIDLDGN